MKSRASKEREDWVDPLWQEVLDLLHSEELAERLDEDDTGEDTNVEDSHAR